MNSSDRAPWPSPTGVASVLDDILAATEPGLARPPLTYLRRKPGRGMVAVYGSPSFGSMYTVTVDESAMASGPATTSGGTPRGSVLNGGTQTWQDEGLARIPALGLTVQRFPHDESLVHLPAAIAPEEGTPLWRALAEVATGWPEAHTGQAVVTLRSARAVPLRYKPGDRCVIRYHLDLAASDGSTESLTVIGKLYQTVDQAETAAALMERLWQAQGSQPWSARPLGVVTSLPLVLTEDLGSSADKVPTLAGTEVIRFGGAARVDAKHVDHAGFDAEPINDAKPFNPGSLEAVRRAARALAELHTSATVSDETPTRTGADESAKAAKRASAIARYAPSLAETTAAVGTALTTALASLPACSLRPSHGSYKPSQLLVRSGAVYVVDFDQFAQADPALDVGYFLAYLRPPGLWYQRAGTRAWFETAAATFLSAYVDAAAERGMDPVEREEIQRRCHVYEAALLMKIAARRPNRLHSPRPQEVKALLDEVMACLAGA